MDMSTTQRRWTAVGGAFISLLLGPGVHYAFGIIQAELIERRALGTSSRALVGGAASISTGLMLFGAYFSAKLQDYIGTSSTVMIGAIASVIGLISSGLSTRVWHFYLSFGLLVGVGHSLQFPPCTVAVARYFEGSLRAGLASGVATSGSGVGAILLGLVNHVTIIQYNWRWAFFLQAMLTSLLLPLAARAVGGKDKRIEPKDDIEPKKKCPAKLQRFAMTAALYGFGWEVAFVHLVSYARDEGHSNAAASGLVIAVGIGGLAGRIASLALADCIGHEIVLIGVCFLTSVADAVLPFLVRYLTFLYFFGLLVGTTAGACIGLTTPLAKATIANAKQDISFATVTLSQASGLVYSAMSPGLVAGPILAGHIRDRMGSFDLAFAYAAICWFLAFVVSLPLRHLRSQQGEKSEEPKQHKQLPADEEQEQFEVAQ